MPKPKPLLLYSVNTKLAYAISERYYRGKHYVWCARDFDARRGPSYETANPPTSNPCEILRSLAEEVRRGDRHSAKIEQNKIGILRGASWHAAKGTITEAQKEDIDEILETAEVVDFRPLLYVMPFAAVARLVREASVKERAHPLSQEYLIEALPRNRFDIIDFHGD